MYKQLTSEQRYTISVLLQRKCTKNEIAKAIGVSNSTITRELKRNSSTRGVYKWDKAQRQAEKRKHQVPGNRSVKPLVRDMAIDLLKRYQWSPEQISGYLARKGYKISHETIYAIIRKDKYENRGSLYKHCRHKLKHRRKPVGKRVVIPDRVSIHLRPPEADGKRFGDFEMDTIVGSNNQGAILTMVERSTNMLFMKKLRHGKDADELAQEAIRLLAPYKGLIKTITTDNGTEFCNHKAIARGLDTTVYFTDPYASWQKGAIENANGLIRQYIPKSSPIKNIKDRDIEAITAKINARPRKKLNFSTPTDEFFNYLLY
ncbi:MAG: IS30 family transposase [Prevotella sp.]|nr:IS30 family transposase [Prevotella sp.]